ncbi:MAG: hypothetical protein LM589_03370 [Thermosphaera sp.]|nr:hypothetical protein [Thermosphaera sp.]
MESTTLLASFGNPTMSNSSGFSVSLTVTSHGLVSNSMPSLSRIFSLASTSLKPSSRSIFETAVEYIPRTLTYTIPPKPT